MPNKLCWAYIIDLLSLTCVVGSWSRLIWLCWVKIIGFRGLLKCIFYLPKWMNGFNLIKFLLWPICVDSISPPSSSQTHFALIHFMDLWYLYVLRLVDCKINISMDDIRSPTLHILFVCFQLSTFKFMLMISLFISSPFL